jgi:protoporphyrinogen oxidase
MQVVIVGAGVAGLTLAHKLLASGIDTVVIEREESVGGLARSFTYSNGSIFDIGPHRFHTDDSNVQNFIAEILAEDLIFIDRNSQLFIYGKYLPWPITLKSVLSLPPKLLIMSAVDMLFPKKAKTESFEDYIIEKYGKTLFKVFFKPYTEKFVNYTASNIHSDWASTGINRATIDKKVDTSSLISLFKSTLFAKSPNTKFIYPKSGGMGVFCSKLSDIITSKGGQILLSSQITKFLKNNKNKITSVVTDSGDEIPADHIFWSGSLEALAGVGEAPSQLPKVHYMSSLFFNYLTNHQISQGFQWCYFGNRDMAVNRISVPRNFNPICIPEGKEGLCIEVCCKKDSEIWNDPALHDCVVETFLLKAGLLETLNSVEEFYVEKISETYPMYTLNYPRKLGKVFKWVDNTLQNVTLLGRTGRFWYNNMDHSISASLEVAKRFISDFEKNDLKKGNAYSVEDRYLES